MKQQILMHLIEYFRVSESKNTDAEIDAQNFFACQPEQLCFIHEALIQTKRQYGMSHYFLLVVIIVSLISCLRSN